MARAWKLVIAAGGTGGHISPALAVAEHLGRIEPSCRVEFVCGTRPVEIEIYHKAGIEPKVMEIQPLVRGWRALANVCNLRRSLRAARAYLRGGERPRVVVGMGGYVCVPVVLAAAGARIPTMIHEQNAVAGRANRWLGRRVRAIACAYPEAARAFPRSKTRVTGNPVRAEFVGGDREVALRRWELSAEVPTLLVFGDSQGAHHLNQVVLEAVNLLDDTAADSDALQLLWSCGERNFDELNERLRRCNLRRLTARLVPFIREMGLAYAAADLALCRAGAMTLAELTANGLPAILVPLPAATAAHQHLNARPLVQAGAVVVIEEDKLDGRGLATEVDSLLSDRPRLEQMRQASKRLGRPRAADEIVAMILKLRGELS